MTAGEKGGHTARHSSTIASKAERPLPCEWHWQRQNAAAHTQKPVPLGKRGVLWEWSGQFSHLPPPSDGIASFVPQTGLHIPRAGGEQ